MPIRLNGTPVDERTLRAVAAFILLYVGFWAVGAAVIAIDSAIGGVGLGTLDSLGASATTLGNVGPGFGIAGPYGSFAEFGDVSKVTMIGLMWVGRLEIVPVVVLADAPLLAPMSDATSERRGERDADPQPRQWARPRAPDRRAGCTVDGSTSSVRPCRNTEISREPAGSATPAHLLPGRRRPTFDLDLHDDEPLLLELEQMYETVLGHLVLDQPEDARRRTDRLRDAEQVEVLLVARVVDACDCLAHAIGLLRDLRDHEVVLVVARHSQEELGRPRDPGALEDGDLGGIAADDDRTELLLEPRETIWPLLDHRHLVAEVEQRPRHVRAHLPTTRDDDVHQAGVTLGVAARTVSRRPAIAVCVGQTMLIPRSE